MEQSFWGIIRQHKTLSIHYNHGKHYTCCWRYRPCRQFNFVRVNNKLNMTMHFRSSDLFLGLPYDIIVGALFLKTIADRCGLIPSTLGLNLADAHIYESHTSQVIKYISAETFKLPTLQGKYDAYSLSLIHI